MAVTTKQWKCVVDLVNRNMLSGDRVEFKYYDEWVKISLGPGDRLLFKNPESHPPQLALTHKNFSKYSTILDRFRFTKGRNQVQRELKSIYIMKGKKRAR